MTPQPMNRKADCETVTISIETTKQVVVVEQKSRVNKCLTLLFRGVVAPFVFLGFCGAFVGSWLLFEIMEKEKSKKKAHIMELEY